jgi:hypothetical protein
MSQHQRRRRSTGEICDLHPDAIHLAGVHLLSRPKFLHQFCRVEVPASLSADAVHALIVNAMKQAPDRILLVDAGGRTDVAVVDSRHFGLADVLKHPGFVVHGAIRGEMLSRDREGYVVAAVCRCPKPWIRTADELYDDEMLNLGDRDTLRGDHDGIVAAALEQTLAE